MLQSTRGSVLHIGQERQIVAQLGQEQLVGQNGFGCLHVAEADTVFVGHATVDEVQMQQMHARRTMSIEDGDAETREAGLRSGASSSDVLDLEIQIVMATPAVSGLPVDFDLIVGLVEAPQALVEQHELEPSVDGLLVVRAQDVDSRFAPEIPAKLGHLVADERMVLGIADGRLNKDFKEPNARKGGVRSVTRLAVPLKKDCFAIQASDRGQSTQRRLQILLTHLQHKLRKRKQANQSANMHLCR
jgi:hypothetical protein